MRIALFLFIAAIEACSNPQSGSNPSKDTGITNTDSSSTPESPSQTDYTKDSVITIKFPKDSSSITVTGRLNGINKPVTVNIPIKQGNKLTALLVPQDSVANIRINQIFMPDGKADGPFGRSLERKIAQQGNYKLIIGENLMQGDEWKGKFTLKITVN